MRRRPLQMAVPEELARFVASEWPQPGVARAFAAWCKARIAFATEYPDAALGDEFDAIAANRQTRLRMPPFDNRIDRED